jgi:hypothetical protein
MSEAELEGVLSARKVTAHQAHQCRCEDGVWQKGGHTVAYCDKMIRSRRTYPHTPRTVCKETKPVNEFTQSAPPEALCAEAPRVPKCGNDAKVGPEEGVLCPVPKISKATVQRWKAKPVGCSLKGATRTKCRNEDAAKRNRQGRQGPHLRICSGCSRR